jgi:hypothetical protein
MTTEASPASPWRRWRLSLPLASVTAAGRGHAGDRSCGRGKVVVNAATASAATVDVNNWYVLVNRNSGKATRRLRLRHQRRGPHNPMDPQQQQPTMATRPHRRRDDNGHEYQAQITLANFRNGFGSTQIVLRLPLPPCSKRPMCTRWPARPSTCSSCATESQLTQTKSTC